MDCPRCGTPVLEVARFCPRCGEHLAGGQRHRHYAAAGHEPVASVSVVSTVMPHSVPHAHHHYRIALALGVAVPVVAAAMGFLTFAVVSAAVAVPVVYLVYLYDVDVWEQQPLPVVIGCGLLTAGLGVGWTLLWQNTTSASEPAVLALNQLRASDLLVLGLLVPVVSLVLALVGPLLLARLPRYDDLMDGLVLGFTAGAVFAGASTIVEHRGLLGAAPVRYSHVDAGLWVAVVGVGALVKPLVFGLACGLAAAEFTGLGPGPGRVSARFGRGLLEAAVAVVLLDGGLYLLGLVGDRAEAAGALLGLVWGLAVAAALLVRVRLLVHNGLLEAALLAVREGAAGQHATVDSGHCPHCQLPLVDQALFCLGCGTSVRALPKQVRSRNTAPSPLPRQAAGVAATPSDPAPDTEPGGERGGAS